jgi:hypothetical protein
MKKTVIAAVMEQEDEPPIDGNGDPNAAQGVK